VPAPAAPAAAAMVNVNTAFSKQLELLGLTKEEAAKVVAGRPYKVKQELVLRGGLPKAKFDSIKDRITLTQ
jgi:DNA uptake protein ComE-like DNA-binding protein